MSSWITGLADKAENILNKIDQNAATALQIAEDGTGGSSSLLADGKLMLPKSLAASTQSLQAMLTPKKGNRDQERSELTAELAASDRSQTGHSRQSSVSSTAAGAVAIDLEDETLVLPTNTPAANAIAVSFSGNNSQEVAAFRIALSEITSERDDLRRRLAALQQDNEKLSLRQRLQDFENLVQSLSEERDALQLELKRIANASEAQQHSIGELESNLAKLQQQFFEQSQKLQMQIKETEQQRQELQDYRTKAQRALHAKDALIAELKANSLISGSVITASERENSSALADETPLRLLQIEFDALQKDHQHTLQDHQKLSLLLEEMRRDFAALQQQQSVEHLKELQIERERALAAESEQRVLSQELVSLRQQLSNQLAAAATRIQEKDQQLQVLSSKSQSSKVVKPVAASADSEMRIKSLTQALVEKQSAIENVTADRNALRIQLEKIQNERHQFSESSNENHINIGSNRNNPLLANTTDDVKSQFPIILRENPFDTRVTRRVKKAYSTLDSAGIRLGAFLRRYPLMRIFVLMYVALLHLWVMFILLSYSPS